jgi:hypothetical protein
MYKRKKNNKLKSNENNLTRIDENELSSHILNMLTDAKTPAKILL